MSNQKKLVIISGCVALLLFTGFIETVQGQTTLGRKRSLLTGMYSQENVKENILPREDWAPFPKSREAGWEKIPTDVRRAHIREGEKIARYRVA